MVKTQLKCINFFQDHPFECISFNDLCLRLDVDIEDFVDCINNLVQRSILKKEVADGLLKYRYNIPKIVYFNMKE